MDFFADEELSKLTTCEAISEVTSNGTAIDSARLLRTGLKPGEDGKPSKCYDLARKEAKDLCHKNEGTVDSYVFLYSLKQAEVEENPGVSPCTGPEDPRCLDPLTTAFILESVEGNFVTGSCLEF